jgi:hypothetical protein
MISGANSEFAFFLGLFLMVYGGFCAIFQTIYVGLRGIETYKLQGIPARNVAIAYFISGLILTFIGIVFWFATFSPIIFWAFFSLGFGIVFIANLVGMFIARRES